VAHLERIIAATPRLAPASTGLALPTAANSTVTVKRRETRLQPDAADDVREQRTSAPARDLPKPPHRLATAGGILRPLRAG
jgi:hypothetical protein